MMSTQTVAPTRSVTSGRQVAGRVAGVALVICISAMGLVQVVAIGDRNPFTATLSSYAWATDGWLFGLSLLSLAVATATLALLARRPRLRSGTGVPSLLLLASAAAVGAAVFPADPEGLSAGGEAHRWFSIVLLVAIPAAALLMLRGQGGLTVLGRRRRTIARLIGISAAAGALFLLAQSTAAPLGQAVSQRVLVTAVVALAVLISVEVRRPGLPQPAAATG